MKTCKHPTCEDQCRRVKKKQKSLPQLDGILWDVFSVFIRLRDADKDGFCKCFTCPNIRKWNKGDAGHGIPRQHKATKFDEKNNHFQCKHCNGFEGGRREVYKIEMDNRYGAGTWDLMEFKSRQGLRWTAFEYEQLILHYRREVIRLKKEKNII